MRSVGDCDCSGVGVGGGVRGEVRDVDDVRGGGGVRAWAVWLYVYVEIDGGEFGGGEK